MMNFLSSLFSQMASSVLIFFLTTMAGTVSTTNVPNNAGESILESSSLPPSASSSFPSTSSSSSSTSSSSPTLCSSSLSLSELPAVPNAPGAPRGSPPTFKGGGSSCSSFSGPSENGAGEAGPSHTTPPSPVPEAKVREGEDEEEEEEKEDERERVYGEGDPSQWYHARLPPPRETHRQWPGPHDELEVDVSDDLDDESDEPS